MAGRASVTTAIGVALSILASAAVVLAAQGVVRQSTLTAPAPAPQVTVPIDEGQVTKSIDTNGSIAPSLSAAVPIPTLVGGETPLVTQAANSTTPVASGSLLFQVAGLPVLALQGQVGMYRALNVGASGPDVAEFQQALAGLGLRSTDKAGVFGSSTSLAAWDFFHSRGLTAEDGSGVPIASRNSAKNIVIPLNQLVYFPTLPATIAGSCTQVGATLTSTSCTLSSLASQVSVQLSAQEYSQTQVGMGVEMVFGDGTKAHGAVADLADGSNEESSSGNSANDTPGPGPTASIRLDQQPPAQSNPAVTVSIILEQSDPNVLTVAVTAIRSSGDGRFHLDLFVAKSRRGVSTDVSVGLCDVDRCQISGGATVVKGARAILAAPVG